MTTRYIITHDGWADTTEASEDNHVSECEVEDYIATLESKLAERDALIEKLSYDHECCDPENCRFCIAYDALTPEQPAKGGKD